MGVDIGGPRIITKKKSGAQNESHYPTVSKWSYRISCVAGKSLELERHHHIQKQPQN